MTGEAMRDLLSPLVGKSGTIHVVAKTGQVGFTSADDKKLTTVEVRADGLLFLERENGWAVIDPGEVVAVVWSADNESAPGQFL